MSVIFANDNFIINPSFEEGQAGWINSKTGEYEYYAPVDGSIYAVSLGGSDFTYQQTGVTIEAGKTYTVRFWARSIYSDSHTEALKNLPNQYPQGNPALASAEVRLYYGSKTIATETETVNPVALKGAPSKYSNDDGGNVWLDEGYRMEFSGRVFYQQQTADPILDPWLIQYDRDYESDLAVGPVITPQGLKGIFNTYYQDYPPFYSEIWLMTAGGNPPDYDWTSQGKILLHDGDEDPWVIDAHLFYDQETEKLWMSWGGHTCYVTELDPETGKLIGNPENLEFYTHPEGTHTPILSFAGELNQHPDVPEGWEGDEWSSGYMEGPAIYKYNGFYYAFGSYGNLAANYTIRMGRATSVTGPYYDKDGYECTVFYPEIDRYGCSFLLADDSDQLSPGHPHIWEEDGRFYLGYDYIPEKMLAEEVDIMGIRRLYWVNDWPTIWTPVEVSFNADDHPGAIGEKLGISFRNAGEAGSVLAVDSLTLRVSDATAMEGSGGPVRPEEFKLGQNYPNPFNPGTSITFQIPVTSYVELNIFNYLGRKVKTLLQKEQPAGTYTVEWSGENDQGESLASGIYYYQLSTSRTIKIRKALLLK